MHLWFSRVLRHSNSNNTFKLLHILFGVLRIYRTVMNETEDSHMTVLKCSDYPDFRVKPVFHFNRTVPKPTGEHAQIEKRFINPRTSGCIRVSK